MITDAQKESFRQEIRAAGRLAVRKLCEQAPGAAGDLHWLVGAASVATRTGVEEEAVPAWLESRSQERGDKATEEAIRSGELLSGDHRLATEEREVEADRFAHNARIRRQIRHLERRLRVGGARPEACG